MKILVTGGSGRLGTWVVPALQARGHQVVVASRHRVGTGAEHLRLDLADFGDHIDEQPDLSGFDTVIHLAGASDRRAAADFDLINHRATAKLARAAASSGVRAFVFASSILVHGDAAMAPLSSESPVDPVDDYARSKVLAERALVDPELEPMQRRVLRLAAFTPTGEASPAAQSIARRVKRIPVPRTENRRAVLTESGLMAAIDECLSSASRGGYSVRLVADGHRSFRQDIELAIASGPVDRQLCRLPRWCFRFGDAAVRALGGPSLAALYRDLPVA